VKGYPKRIWQKTRDRNEALDCRVYARAAAIALGIDRWSESRWKQLSGIIIKREESDVLKIKAESIPQISAKSIIRRRSGIIRSNFLQIPFKN
jgi:phage terminase large subunit GpA-like protein